MLARNAEKSVRARVLIVSKPMTDRRQLKLPAVLPQLRLLPGLPQLNVTGSGLDTPPVLVFD